MLYQAIEIGVAGSKSPREPISTALGNPLAASDHVELTGLTRCNDGFNVQALLDEDRETRDPGIVVLSRRVVNDFDLHSVLLTLREATSWLSMVAFSDNWAPRPTWTVDGKR